MVSGGDEIHKDWTHAWAFDVYEVSRAPVSPALEMLVQQPLSRYVASEATILEVGAGAGALRRFAGNIGAHYQWVETDQNPDFLALPRKHASVLMSLVLPDLSVPTGEVNAIVGLGVFDTLSLETLRKTAEASYDKLAESGVVMHWLDMSPDYWIEILNARSEGLFPIPFVAPDGPTGMYYMELEGLTERIRRLPIDPNLKGVFLYLITNPKEAIHHLDRTPLLPHLAQVAKGGGLVVSEEEKWMTVLGHRYSRIWADAGFTILKNEVITASAHKPRKQLDRRYQEATHIRRVQGVVKAEMRPKSRIPPGQVQITADAHLFVAQK